MYNPLENKIALITGASRGIGVKIAERLALGGALTVINYSRSEAGALAAAELIESNGGRALTVKASVDNPQEVLEMFAYIRDKAGEVDILVNNAGITKDNLLVRMSDEDFEAVLATNLKGAIYCAKSAVPAMLQKGYGKVINISSVVGFSGNAGQVNYVSSKGGLIGFTRSLAAEFGGGGVRVNAVAPGFIQTDMTDVLPEEMKNSFKDNIILKTFGKAEDVANAVYFLAAPDSDYITGQTIHVNGGLYL